MEEFGVVLGSVVERRGGWRNVVEFGGMLGRVEECCVGEREGCCGKLLNVGGEWWNAVEYGGVLGRGEEYC